MTNWRRLRLRVGRPWAGLGGLVVVGVVTWTLWLRTAESRGATDVDPGIAMTADESRQVLPVEEPGSLVDSNGGGPETGDRLTRVMALWRKAIAMRDPEGMLACDRLFTDEPLFFRAALVEATKPGDERLRAFSTRVLGKFTDPTLAGIFLKLLADDSAFVRANAAWALGRLSSDTSRAALERARAQDTAESVRQSATEALAHLEAMSSGSDGIGEAGSALVQ